MDRRCPLVSLGKAAIFYSCSVYQDGALDGDPLTPTALQHMVEVEDSIRGMTTPGDPPTTGASVGSDIAGYIIDILQKIDQIGKVIAEVSPRYVS